MKKERDQKAMFCKIDSRRKKKTLLSFKCLIGKKKK